ncbi:nucleotide disphospho-sugar-binding domain-containing protein [Actinoplanes sp. NPDC051861]|uniref:nucleotide disphospho-sugar-binding domain-containing protein n=1 Tax=Actinoplanes sp. NPDC051861 TaxID=3155170 RepID=UPI00342F0A06
MRVLSMAAPASGMYLPAVPLAWALRAAGHEVLMANNGPAAAAIARAGLPVVDACPDRDLFAEFVAVGAQARKDGTPPGTNLGLFGEAMLEDLLRHAESFKPDVIVSTLEQGAGPIVAAALGVPLLEQSVRLAWAGPDRQARDFRAGIAARLWPLRVRLGLPVPAEAVAFLDVRPKSLGGHDGPGAWPMRYVPYNHGLVLPEWLAAPPQRPRIGVTLGSFLAGAAGAQLRELIGVLAEFDAEVVLALGEVDLSEIGPLPPNVRSAGWVPLDSLLPSCAAVVHHGGSGTTFAALTAGVPQVVLPRGADQPANAAVVARRGTGVALDPRTADASTLRAAVRGALDDGALRAAAAEVAAEIAAQPAPSAVAERVADLASSRLAVAG